jgi:hypothetical protein
VMRSRVALPGGATRGHSSPLRRIFLGHFNHYERALRALEGQEAWCPFISLMSARQFRRSLGCPWLLRAYRERELT